MHDEYAYERVEMALHDHPVHRFMACGVAGLSVAADSLSAVKYARVKVIRDATGLAVDFLTEGEFPAYGNNDDRADALAVGLVESFMAKVRRHPTYRDAEHTQSVLTITSNVVYGKHTGNTPDGRRTGQPFVRLRHLPETDRRTPCPHSRRDEAGQRVHGPRIGARRGRACRRTAPPQTRSLEVRGPRHPFPLRDTPVPDPALTESVRERFREQGVAAY